LRSAQSAVAGTPAVSQDESSGCADILFVGARGSGQKGPGDPGWKPTNADPYGFGSTVNSAYQRLVKDLGSHRTEQPESVAYAANGVQTLAHAPNQYFANLAVGVNWTLGTLEGQAAECPAQQIVLAGFSQGAMVMHRVLLDLGATGATAASRAILARVAAAILVGDGDQIPFDYETRYGTASTNARGIGQAMRNISHSPTAGFSASLTARVLSVCNNHDVVCGWTDSNIACLITSICIPSFAIRVTIHLSYPGSKPLLSAADRAAALAREIPAPEPVSIGAHEGVPVSYRLKADIASGFTLQWRVAPGAKLPPGLSLNGNGQISGVPTTTDYYETEVQVRSVRAHLDSPWLPTSVTFNADLG
jgi:hypothetical protein